MIIACKDCDQSGRGEVEITTGGGIFAALAGPRVDLSRVAKKFHAAIKKYSLFASTLNWWENAST
jgi:hypothetical protein